MDVSCPACASKYTCDDEKLRGKIHVIVKPGLKHHPHGLDDPTPAVDFILKNLKGQ